MHLEMTRILVLLVLLLVAAGPVSADIYKWTDENGYVHYSNEKPNNQEVEKIVVQVNSYESISYATSSVDIGKKVVMYSASWCGYCRKARQYFNKNRIAFTEYDIEKSAQGKREYKKLGAKGVHVILVGKRRMNGFSEAGFEKLYR